jgi:hypothetical protein
MDTPHIVGGSGAVIEPRPARQIGCQELRNSRYRGQFLANRDMRLPIQMTAHDIVRIPEV